MAAFACACTDTGCPLHPSNHDQGCTLCIRKNLAQKEIPSCFFHDVGYPKPTEGWHYEDFAALIQAAQQAKAADADSFEAKGETKMKLQAGTPQDMDRAMSLIDSAKAFLKAQGIDQWQTGYPDRACIERDLAAGKGFFLIDPEGEAQGYLCIDLDGEPAYDQLDGAWLTGLENRSYAVVHRLALSSASRGKGLASVAFREAERFAAERGLRSVRMDTDDDNRIMKHLLAKFGYTYCGKIRFDNSDKIAFEKLISADE